MEADYLKELREIRERLPKHAGASIEPGGVALLLRHLSYEEAKDILRFLEQLRSS